MIYLGFFLYELGANGLANPRDFQTPTGTMNILFFLLKIQSGFFFSMV